MKSKRIVAIALALAASFGSFNASAAVDVYSQASNGILTDTSAIANLPADPGFTWTLDQDEQAWHYFTVGTSVSFNRIGWSGSNADGNFAVDLFAATCFSCGASPVGTDGTFANNMLPTSGPYGAAQVHQTPISGGQYSYYIDLPSNLTLTGGSTYAISIVNNYTAHPFTWAGSASGSGVHLNYIIGQAMFLRAPGNLAFTLTDTTVSAVPEPAVSLMFGAGLLILLNVSRKRKKVF